MIWLTWRQFRAQAITAAAALAAFAILLAATEPDLSGMYNSSGLLTCHGGACSGLASQFLENLSSGGGGFLIPGSPYMILYFLGVLLILIAPAVTGCFWGAPLISRELEAGTFRLAWNQSITRTRWLAVKLALTGAAAMAVAEAFSLIQAWWAVPISKAVGLGGASSIFSEGRFGWFAFPTHGITPLGYAAFAFALGVTAGLLIRHPIPAMAITLAIFAAVQFITPLWIRPNLFPTSQTVTTITATGANVSLRADPKLTVTAGAVPGQPGAWIISSEGVNAAGQPGPHHTRGLPVGDIGYLGQHRVARGRARLSRAGQLRGQPRDPGRRKLPARQPLLAPPVVRDRDVPGPRPGPGLATASGGSTAAASDK